MGTLNRQRRKHKQAKQRRKNSQQLAKLERNTQRRNRHGGGGLSYTVIPNPFADYTPEEMDQQRQHRARKAEEQYHDSMSTLNDLLRNYHPWMMLSALSAYALTSGVTDKGVTEVIQETPGVTQPHVEFFQALFLTLTIDQFGTERMGAEEYSRLTSALHVLFTATGYRYIDRAVKTTPSRMRLPIFNIMFVHAPGTYGTGATMSK